MVFLQLFDYSYEDLVSFDVLCALLFYANSVKVMDIFQSLPQLYYILLFLT